MTQAEHDHIRQEYGEMSEIELMGVARAYEGLQPEAQTLLREEFSRRSLQPPLIEEETELAYQHLVTVAKYRDLSEAIVARAALEAADIPCFLKDENMIRMDWGYSNFLGGLRLQVPAQDTARARAVLSAPRPDTIDFAEDPSFEQPTCPKCGSAHIELDSPSRSAAIAVLYLFNLPIPPNPNTPAKRHGIASPAAIHGWTKAPRQPSHSLATIDLNLHMESSSQAAVLPSPATSADPIISAQHLGKIYGSGKLKVEALRDVTFDVQPGEFVAIVGPSGSGKSTLFYILGGLTSATSGSLLIQGKDFSRLSDPQRTSLRRSQIGFVFQRFNLLPTISAQANIELAHEIAATGKPFDQALLNELTGLLKIEGRLDHRPNELSGGEQQRVAIARALITRPAILLADEPTGNLDSQNADTVLSMLHSSSRELNQTVLMITHNPEAAQIADRILHMRDGQIVKIEQGSRRVDRTV